jgi:hypothetical protein
VHLSSFHPHAALLQRCPLTLKAPLPSSHCRNKLAPHMKVQLYVSSNNQLVCLCCHILSRAGLPAPAGWVFDNGTVIRMAAAPDGAPARIHMIHPRAVSNPERFVSPEVFNEAMAGASLVLPPQTTVYVVRHGHAAHNEPSASLQDAHDAHLTATGTQQAALAGSAVNEDLLSVDMSALSLYSSDLLRTMHTAAAILDQLHACPLHLRPTHLAVCIEARENTRPIGGVHHWQVDNPLRRVAIDPFCALEQLRLLAPGKTDEQIERLRVENLPKNDPLDWDKCIKHVAHMEVDWCEYERKVRSARAAGATFGDAAAETLFLDVILGNAQ